MLLLPFLFLLFFLLSLLLLLGCVDLFHVRGWGGVPTLGCVRRVHVLACSCFVFIVAAAVVVVVGGGGGGVGCCCWW